MSVYFRFLVDAIHQSWGEYAPAGTRSTLTFPTRSGVAGLLANALGLDRAEVDKIDSIHRGIRVSSRVLRKERILRDNQNKRFCPVDGDPWDMQKPTKNPMTTAQNRRSALLTPEQHSTSEGRKVSERYYLNDWAFQVVVEVLPSCPFSAKAFIKALQSPARGIYFGRKTCIPLRPLISDGDTEPLEANSPMEVFSIPTAPLYDGDLDKAYPWADPSGRLEAHLDMLGEPVFPGCIMVPEILNDACYSTNGRIFHSRRVLHVTRFKGEE